MKKTYHGSCHCKAVRFEVDIDLSHGTGRCNCSICRKQRNWSIGLKPADFRLLSGEDNLGDYQFGTMSGHHRFCKTCGINTHGHGHIPEIGGDYVSVKLSVLDDMSEDELVNAPVRFMNGRDNDWFHTPPETRYL
ncbi:MAG TPA: GFA family protein [Asticcacaulis sp.]|nr:GFA family protein [Asticcacaulis sp.]